MQATPLTLVHAAVEVGQAAQRTQARQVASQLIAWSQEACSECRVRKNVHRYQAAQLKAYRQHPAWSGWAPGM